MNALDFFSFGVQKLRFLSYHSQQIFQRSSRTCILLPILTPASVTSVYTGYMCSRQVLSLHKSELCGLEQLIRQCILCSAANTKS